MSNLKFTMIVSKRFIYLEHTKSLQAKERKSDLSLFARSAVERISQGVVGKTFNLPMV